jgi:transcriptional regulator with XRE-family HTH domain
LKQKNRQYAKIETEVIKMYAEVFASRIKKARAETGFTQREVAKETGIPLSTIAKYETERLQPDLEKLGILAEFYGVSIDWLLGLKSNQKI